MNLISIIVPVYNTEMYVSKCIESILSQTYKNFELILVNDGSTDNSIFICNSYAIKDNRVNLINKENEGVSKARNTGIENATGKYITFVDSDDYISPNYLEVLINSIEETKADLAICNYNRLYGTGTILPSGFAYKDFSCDTDSVRELFIYNDKQFVLTAVVRLYSLELIKKNNISFHEDMSYGEDYIFQLQYAMHSKKVSFLVSNVLYHRAEDNSFSLSKQSNRLSGETHNKINTRLLDVIQRDNNLTRYVLLDCLERFTQVYKGLVIESYSFKTFEEKVQSFFEVPGIMAITNDICIHITNDPRLKYLKPIISSKPLNHLLYAKTLYAKTKIIYKVRYFLGKSYELRMKLRSRKIDL